MNFLIIFILGLFAFSYLALIWTIHARHVYGGFFGAQEQPAAVSGEVKAKVDAAPAVKKTETKAGTKQGTAYRAKHGAKHKKKQGKK